MVSAHPVQQLSLLKQQHHLLDEGERLVVQVLLVQPLQHALRVGALSLLLQVVPAELLLRGGEAHTHGDARQHARPFSTHARMLQNRWGKTSDQRLVARWRHLAGAARTIRASSRSIIQPRALW